ncbi:post-GPI attachment to proteins factor 2-like [Aricia agestis]|uniref:post-GPI attachment to proteins factor 2-like n=1 Tax=Aricia agestis TaxID=91739 RepID=UPI001C207000|nr:post-GPI attachment to proteins factor 2-like [Aricia agestis]
MKIDAQAQSLTKTDEREKHRTNNSYLESKIIRTIEYKGLLWSCALRDICLTALWLPLGALIFCYVTASIFQADDIHETHCRVYNVVPSISAITGISPQRYVWRICVAYHIGPRLLIGSLYYNYHKERTLFITNEKTRELANKLGEACYWLNFVELLALSGVTYVSNRENYFVHEKIFILFMVAALLHMLCRARVGCLGADIEPVRTNRLVWILFYVAIAATVGLVVFFLSHRLLCRPLGEYYWQQLSQELFYVAIATTVGLVVFFLSHRLLCQPLAFTWFSVCEYILATANMAFHAIIVRDLPLHELQVVGPIRKKTL